MRLCESPLRLTQRCANRDYSLFVSLGVIRTTLAGILYTGYIARLAPLPKLIPSFVAMAMLPKPWQGPALRDVLVQSFRRTPAPHSNNGDSLRRVVLQRNTLMAAADGDIASHSTQPSLRRLSSDFSVAPPILDDLSSRSHSDPLDKYALDSARSIQRPRSAPAEASPARSTAEYDELRVDAWFDGVMDDLDWSEELDPAPSPGAGLSLWAPSEVNGPPPVRTDGYTTLYPIPELRDATMDCPM